MQLATQEQLDKVAEVLHKEGWIQGANRSPQGVCLNTAIMLAFQEQYQRVLVRAELLHRTSDTRSENTMSECDCGWADCRHCGAKPKK